MKPDELDRVRDWFEEYGLGLFLWFCFAACASMLGGGIYDSNTDDQGLWVGVLYAWPWVVPPVLLGLERSVYVLRTRGERKQLKTDAKRAEVERMERELLDAA